MLPQMPQHFDFIHIRSIRDTPHLLLVLFLISGIVLGVYLALQPQIFNKKASEGSLVELNFEPEKIDVEAGKEYQTAVYIEPKGARVTAVALNFGYDPALVNITKVENSGLLPITLKNSDDFSGEYNIVLGTTIDNIVNKKGKLVTVNFKIIKRGEGEITVKAGSQVNISSQEGNVLSVFPKLVLNSQAAPESKSEDLEYPNNLLHEGVVLQEPSPFIRQVEQAFEPKPSVSPDRIQPELSEAYIKQLGKDVFIEPIVALNDVLQKKAEEIITTSDK